MKTFLTIAAAAFLLGCQPPEAAGTNPSASAGKVSPSTVSTPSAPLAIARDVPASTTQPKQPQTLVQNPNRLFQLKNLKIVNLKLGSHPVRAWIMDTESKRQEGMMFLRDGDVSEDQGMIFVFPDLQQKDNAFWMHNTFIPLDIIYIAKDKKIVNVGHGKKLNDDQVKANGPYQYVLEMKAGTSAKWRVGSGSADNSRFPDNQEIVELFRGMVQSL